PFTLSGVLDPDARTAFCDAPDLNPPAPVLYVLRASLTTAPSCKVPDVVAELPSDLAGQAPFVLHVWGDGIDARAETGKRATRPIQLEAAALGKGYYW